jgi:hypothetical protein
MNGDSVYMPIYHAGRSVASLARYATFVLLSRFNTCFSIAMFEAGCQLPVMAIAKAN